MAQLLAYVHGRARGESFTIKERDYKGGTKTLSQKHKPQIHPKKKKKTLNHQKYMTRET